MLYAPTTSRFWLLVILESREGFVIYRIPLCTGTLPLQHAGRSFPRSPKSLGPHLQSPSRTLQFGLRTESLNLSPSGNQQEEL